MDRYPEVEICLRIFPRVTNGTDRTAPARSGYAAAMTEPEPEPAAPSSADTALERSKESVRRAREAVGDGVEGGGLVPPDDAQDVQPPG